jgi:hypothetical protein
MIVEVINTTKKTSICRAEVAKSFLRRAVGLMLASPAREEGLLIEFSSAYSRSIHSFFMRFPLELVFIDNERRVTEVKTLVPWRVVWPGKPCRWVLEIGRGRLSPGDVEPGDRLEFRVIHGPG